MRRAIVIILALLFYSTLFGGSFFFWQDKFQASLISSGPDVDKEKSDVVLLFAGDIMLDRGTEWHIRQHQDWKWPFLRIADSLNKADFVFANLESVISDKGQNLGSIYSFRADPKALEGLTFAGFDVLSVANNHSLDYGSEALLDSIKRLKDAGIAPVGGGETKKETNAPVLKRYYTSKYSSATTIGILAYTAVGSPLWQAGEQSPGIAWMDASKLSQLKEDIKAAKEVADIVVVSFHYGDEYQKEPNATQRLLSTSAIDYGADLVVGHHPHVAQPVEQYKNGWVAYSLGNFVFDQGFSKETMQGMLLRVLVKEKNITEVMPLSIQISKGSQPAISTESIK